MRTELSPPTCNNTKLVNYGSFKFIHSHIYSFNKYILCINYKVLLEAWGIILWKRNQEIKVPVLKEHTFFWVRTNIPDDDEFYKGKNCTEGA